jgi:hypothetical protein
VLVVSAAATASASATEFFHKGGTAISGVLLVDSSGGVQVLTGEAAGQKVEIVCNHLDNHGTIENVNGMGLGLLLLLYLTCTVPKPGANCLVAGTEMSIHVPHVHILTIGTSTVPLVEVKPALGTTFVNIVFENCTGVFAALNNKAFPVTGFAVGKANNATGEVEFGLGAPNNHLVFAGEEATYMGNDKIEMTGGGELEVK